MEHDFLKQHKFQFRSYCHIVHEKYLKKSRIHFNGDSHLIHISKGNGRFSIDSEKYPLQAGDVIAVPPFCEFYFELFPGFEMCNIHYDLWLRNGELLCNSRILPLIFHPAYFGYCMKIFGKMDKEAPASIMLESMAHEIVIKHLVSNELQFSAWHMADNRMKKVYKALQSSKCLKYDSDKMAKLSSLSVSQMNRKFRNSFGFSPQKFWEKNRFDNICAALMENALSLGEITELFSFHDLPYFSKWFRKIAGCSPGEYRKRAEKGELGKI